MPDAEKANVKCSQSGDTCCVPRRRGASEVSYAQRRLSCEHEAETVDHGARAADEKYENVSARALGLETKYLRQQSEIRMVAFVSLWFEYIGHVTHCAL